MEKHDRRIVWIAMDSDIKFNTGRNLYTAHGL
jgi:hypothetical protein